MKFYISTFYNLRYFKENQIILSTCASDPKYFHNKENKWCNNQGYYINSNNVLLGIREESLSPLNIPKEDCPCEKDCKYRDQNPNCSFLINYDKYLQTIDFNALLKEFKRVAEEVRKVTNYQGEPEIVLLVYEAVGNPCSERLPLVNLFKEHNIELKEFTKETNQ